MSRQRRKRASPLPLSLAMYWEDVRKPATPVHRWPVPPAESPRKPLFLKVSEEKKRTRKALHITCGSIDPQRPGSELQCPTELTSTDFYEYKDKFDLTTNELSDLRQRVVAVLTENMRLRQLAEKEKESAVQCCLENWDREEMVEEVHQLHCLLSSAHQTIEELQRRRHSFLVETERARESIGMLRYNFELTANTNEVRAALVLSTQLQETIRKRLEDRELQKRDLQQLADECVEMEKAVEEEKRENKALLQVTFGLEEKSSPELLNIAQLYEKLRVTTSLIEKTEDRISACEEFIQSQMP